MNRAQKRSGFRGGSALQRGEVGRERVIGQRLIPRSVDDLLGQLVDKLRVQSRPLLAQLAEALLLVDSADLLEARGLMVPLQGITTAGGDGDGTQMIGIMSPGDVGRPCTFW